MERREWWWRQKLTCQVSLVLCIIRSTTSGVCLGFEGTSISRPRCSCNDDRNLCSHHRHHQHLYIGIYQIFPSWALFPSQTVEQLTNGEGVEFGAEMVCGRMGGLSRRQREICKSSPEAMIAIADGIKLAMDECHHQFNYHRWNCSALNQKHPLGYVITVGSKEAAFIYSIVSGGVSYAISRACSRGELATCGCDLSSANAHATWKWSGCGVDVNYGVKLARKFLDAREVELDARSRMNLHNNKAGRMVVKNNMVQICKCHGVSGSCSMKTCWKGLPQFRRIGTLLMEKYYRARKGVWSRSGGLRTMKKKLKPRGTELIYLEPSPNYCQANANLGSLGTKGRTCNKTSAGMASCNVLCCGRGYNTHQYIVSKQCNCKFHWCCYVQCNTCTDLVQVHTCK